MFFHSFFRSRQVRRSLIVAGLMAASASVSQAAPPTLYDAEIPTQVVVGTSPTFRVGFKDPDGDPPKQFICTVEGPGGTQKKEYTAIDGARATSGTIAEFPMGPFSLDGQYTVRFTVSTGDGTVQTPPQSFVVVNLTRRWYELAGGVAVALLVLPLLVFLFSRIVTPRSDPRSSARFGLIAGVGAAYIWYLMLFGAVHQGLGIAVGAVITLAAVVALLSGLKKK